MQSPVASIFFQNPYTFSLFNTSCALSTITLCSSSFEALYAMDCWLSGLSKDFFHTNAPSEGTIAHIQRQSIPECQKREDAETPPQQHLGKATLTLLHHLPHLTMPQARILLPQL